YYGNYLNYSVCTTCGTDQSKISIAKTVLINLVNNTAGVRFGAEKYAAGGGLVMEEIKDMTSTNKQILVDSINNMDLNSSGNPLGPQLKHAGDYYEGHLTGLNSPMQYAWHPTFVTALTHGKSTGPAPRLEAEGLYTQDHSSTFAGMQNIVVHVIAFALPQADKDAGAIQALKETAVKGGGRLFQDANA